MSATDVLNLVIKAQDRSEVHFKVKMGTKLQKMFIAYCTKKGLELNAVKFLYDGHVLSGEDATPGSLEMEDGDSIDVMQTQVGGDDS